MFCAISHIDFNVISRLIQSWLIRGKMNIFLLVKTLESIVFMRII